VASSVRDGGGHPLRGHRPLLVALVLATATLAGGAATTAAADRTAMVDMGAGRKLYLDCQGAGSPTVFIIPGKGSYAEVWNVAVPVDDPIRSSPYDIINEAKLAPSPAATQPTVAKTTRVCAYDRPDTRPDGADQSTPAPQPHTVQADVDDVVKLLSAAHLSTPVVVVAHSYGGLIADLLARTRPELVGGLVMVDPLSEFLPTLGSAEQNAAFDRDAQSPPDPGGEGFLAEDAYARIAQAPPLPRVPAIVLSSDKFAPAADLTPENYSQEQIHRANGMLADALGTTNLTVTDSGHNMMLYQPQRVADEIVAIVDQVRAR
jgi:pimeloyl-ACP methyl ester carboxylesterase